MRDRRVKGTKERAEAWNMKGKREEGNKAMQHGIQRETREVGNKIEQQHWS